MKEETTDLFSSTKVEVKHEINQVEDGRRDREKEEKTQTESTTNQSCDILKENLDLKTEGEP